MEWAESGRRDFVAYSTSETHFWTCPAPLSLGNVERLPHVFRESQSFAGVPTLLVSDLTDRTAAGDSGADVPLSCVSLGSGTNADIKTDNGRHVCAALGTALSAKQGRQRRLSFQRSPPGIDRLVRKNVLTLNHTQIRILDSRVPGS
jgi:hypothetical protein